MESEETLTAILGGWRETGAARTPSAFFNGFFFVVALKPDSFKQRCSSCGQAREAHSAKTE